MTAREAVLLPIRAAGSLSDRFISSSSLCGGPRVQEGRGAHQIVGDDAEPDPASDAVRAMVATASQAMPTFEHTDAAFAPDAPALAAAEPALSFMRASRRRFAPGRGKITRRTPRVSGRVFILGRGKAAIARGKIRRAAEDRDVPIERRRSTASCPPGRVAWTSYAVMI